MGQSLFPQDLIDKIFKTESQKELNIVSCNTVANSSAVCEGGSLQVSHVLFWFLPWHSADEGLLGATWKSQDSPGGWDGASCSSVDNLKTRYNDIIENPSDMLLNIVTYKHNIHTCL